jgi:hypothetical protein
VADLARALRAAKHRAGLTYDQLAIHALCSKPSLAAAAAGSRCPTWNVTSAYLTACGEDPDSLHPLWEEADTADRKSRAKPPRTQLAMVRPLRGRSSGAARVRQFGRPRREPDPWAARTPAEYVYELRALRVWGGNPGYKTIRACSGQWLSESSMYAALSSSRTRMPPLAIVQAVVQACRADAGNWTAAWQELSLRGFEKNNPRPGGDQESETGPGAVIRPA